MKRRIIRNVICLMLSIVAVASAAGDVVVDSAALPGSAVIEGPVGDTVADGDAVVDSSTLPAAAMNNNPLIEPVADTAGAGSISSVPSTQAKARLLLVDGRLNIESLESDMFDGTDGDDEDDEKPSLLLSNDSPLGLGFIILGGVFTFLGTYTMSLLFDERSNSATPEEFNAPIAAGSLLTAWSIASFTIGIHQLRHHARVYNRYAFPERKRATPSPTREAAPVVIRK